VARVGREDLPHETARAIALLADLVAAIRPLVARAVREENAVRAAPVVRVDSVAVDSDLRPSL